MPPGNLLSLVRPDTAIIMCLGRRWELDATTAYDWIGAVGFDFEKLTGIMPGLLGDDDIEDMIDRMWALDVDTRWMYSARVALGRGGGRDWWWTLNLIRRALGAWPYINGLLLLSGLDARTMRLPEWLDACYMALWERADEKGRAAFDMELQMPPVTDVSAPPAAVRAMLAAFAAD